MPRNGDRVRLTVIKPRVHKGNKAMWYGFGRVEGIESEVLFHRDQFCTKNSVAMAVFGSIQVGTEIEGILDETSEGWRLKDVSMVTGKDGVISFQIGIGNKNTGVRP